MPMMDYCKQCSSLDQHASVQCTVRMHGMYLASSNNRRLSSECRSHGTCGLLFHALLYCYPRPSKLMQQKACILVSANQSDVPCKPHSNRVGPLGELNRKANVTADFQTDLYEAPLAHMIQYLHSAVCPVHRDRFWLLAFYSFCL
jgi:hypothetical protein